MAKCGFCRRMFQSPQAVKAHLKHCSRYKTDKGKNSAALGKQPKAAATPAATPSVQAAPPVAAPDLTAPLHDLAKSMSEFSTKQDEPQTLQQQGRQIVQAAKAHVLDHYRTPLGHVTSAMRGHARAAIERELATLPLEELPFGEVLEIAAAIRDACYAPAFTRQAREAPRQHVEAERRHKKEVATLGALLRADRRKKRFMRQANQQAHARCESKTIRGWEHLSILSDIETSLEELLTGSESVPDAYAIMQTVLEGRFLEAAAKQEALQAKADEQWREEVAAVLVLGALVGLVVLALKFPARTLAILNWIERTFGFAPGAEAGTSKSDASETTPPAAGAEARPPSRRRRKDPVPPSSTESPWGNSVGGEPAHA